MSRAVLCALLFVCHFARHRWGFRFKTRDALLHFQRRRLRRFLRVAREAPFYGARPVQSLDDLPIVDKETMLASFQGFNTAGISLDAARGLALLAESNRDFRSTLAGGVTVGSSSGTSGRPNLFLVADRERARWAGAVLGRMLSTASLARVVNPFGRPLRIALFLRANSNLYTSLDGWRIRFHFFDLVQPVESHRRALGEYQPDVLVAPASVLKHIAEDRRFTIAPRQVINVAESLESDDAQSIAARWGKAPQQLYQCTEGVLGFSCEAGSIHLNEECVYFEPQWLDESRSRFSALVTDFSRSTQMFVRFRMDDVLKVSETPCACGRVALRLQSIEGRSDDVLWLPAGQPAVLKPVFPDQVRRAMMTSGAGCADYRIEQVGLQLNVSLDRPVEGDVRAVRDSLAALFESLDLRIPEIERHPWHAQLSLHKRRRIRCLSKPLAAVSA